MYSGVSIDPDQLAWMYRTMVTIRRFEAASRLQADAGKLRGLHSFIGQEAVPAVICARLRADVYVLGTHRSHHHCIAKWVDFKEMMAELLGKATGTNKGKGGVTHIADITRGMRGRTAWSARIFRSSPARPWRRRCRGATR